MKIVNHIKSTVTAVKDLLSFFKDKSIKDVIQDFVDVIKALPRRVRNLNKGARLILKRLAEYSDLPPVQARVVKAITMIKTLFNDIKTDVMTLHDVSNLHQ